MKNNLNTNLNEKLFPNLRILLKLEETYNISSKRFNLFTLRDLKYAHGERKKKKPPTSLLSQKKVLVNKKRK